MQGLRSVCRSAVKSVWPLDAIKAHLARGRAAAFAPRPSLCKRLMLVLFHELSRPMQKTELERRPSWRHGFGKS
jgi:hypothetical protein